MLAVIRCHLLTVILICGLNGCATRPPASDKDALADYNETNDPIEPTNRAIYAFNNGLDTVIMRPAARAYRFRSGTRAGRHPQRVVQSRHPGPVRQRDPGRRSPRRPATPRCAS